jgi:hypothetical protein
VNSCFFTFILSIGGKPNNGLEQVHETCVATIEKRLLPPPPPGSPLNLSEYNYVDKTGMLANIMAEGNLNIIFILLNICC